MRGDTVVLVARVIRDSGEGRGTGPALVQVEEALYNTPANTRELEIDTDVGTSCYRRLQAGERYVIFAHRREGRRNLFSGACSGTFNVREHENILDALRNQAKGGAPRLVGQVINSTGRYWESRSSLPGVTVTADSPSGHYTTTTDGFGNFSLAGMIPDDYRISVTREGFVPDTEFRTDYMTVARAMTGMVSLSAKSCSVWDLAMWANGKISGTVVSSTGRPVEGVPVQVIPFNRQGEPDFSPLRTTVTDRDGKYELAPLPADSYEVGVNALKYDDESPLPPILYESGDGARRTSRFELGESEVRTGIDLKLGAPRKEAILHVRVVGQDGMPYPEVRVAVENLAGVQRRFSKEGTSAAGYLDMPVYQGEKYVVRASDFKQNQEFAGSARIDVTSDSHSVTLVLLPQVRQPE